MCPELATTGAVDFFVSYTWRDRRWAEWVAWQLTAADHTLILQAWDFRPGNDFLHEMHTALQRAERTLALLSDAYLNSSSMGEAEWRSAFADDASGQRRKLVPIRIEPCRPQGLLASRVYIDLVGLDEAAARRALLDGVSDGPARPSLAPEYPGHQQRVAAQQQSGGPSFPAELRNAPASGSVTELPDARVEHQEHAHLQRLLDIHERNVRLLEVQEASHGLSAPVLLLNQLEDERAKVSDLRRLLQMGRS